MQDYTLFVVPSDFDVGPNCRIVQCKGEILNAQEHYDMYPLDWAEIGLINGEGDVAHIEVLEFQKTLKQMEPISAGTSLYFN